jgi:hypothetical protein
MCIYLFLNESQPSVRVPLRIGQNIVWVPPKGGSGPVYSAM